MQWWASAVIPSCALVLCATGCNLEFKPRGWKPTPLSMQTPVPVATGPLAISAVPAYRLVTNPALADAPSRLLVIQVRLSSTDDQALSLTAEDLAVVLPTGELRRVFDRDRALALLRRTMLAQGELSYLHSDGYVPSGVEASARPQLTDMIMSNLLTEGPLTSEYTIQGYVVVDTGVALPSLAGASLEVVAHRLSDSESARGTYQFAAAAPAAAGVPVAAAAPAAAVPAGTDVHVPTPTPAAAAAPSAEALPTATAMPRWARRFAPSAPDTPAADTVPAAASQPAADTPPAVATTAPSAEALPTATAMPRWARRFAPSAPDTPAADTVPAAASQPATDTPPAVATTPEAQ